MFEFTAKDGESVTIYDVMPSDGKYCGSIDFSLQSKLNNSGVIITMTNPDIRQNLAGWYFTEGDNEICISDINIEKIEVLRVTQTQQSYMVYYGNGSNLMAGIVFHAAA